MRRGAALVAIALATGACASAPGGSDRCPLVFGPDPAGLGPWLDSATASAALENAWLATSHLVFAQVLFDSTGVFDRVWVLSRDLGDAIEENYGTIVSRALLEGSLESENRRPLLLGGPDGPGLRAISTIPSCPPSIRNSQHLSRLIGQESRGIQFNGVVVARVQAYVLEDGRVGEVRVDDPSGIPEADQAALRIIQQARFEPAELGGIPVPVWTSFPITFRPVRE